MLQEIPAPCGRELKESLSFAQFLILNRINCSMKNYYLILSFCMFSFLGTAQEDFAQDESFFIGSLDIPPALSELSPEIPELHFNLTDANIFRKDEKREINMLAIVAREKRFQERQQEYETPTFRRKKKEGAIQVSDNVHLYNRGSNYDFYTGKLKNPVYQEMQARLFNDVYRSNYNPYNSYNRYYSPFLR